jgi:catechol 2,3-dioxygenase-like lactoylglutathione lyase family enzyme
MTQALTTGVHHIGLAVPDVDAACAFFCDALSYQVVGGVPDYPAHFVSDGATLITLWQLTDPATATAFDRKRNVGLHHLAISVRNIEALDILFERVKSWPGVTIEFAPCPMREGSVVRHFICAIPGGIRVEFATPFA